MIKMLQLILVVKYYELPYTVHISINVKHNLTELGKFDCKNSNTKIALTSFKIGDTFNVKNPIPKFLKSFAVYKFYCL